MQKLEPAAVNRWPIRADVSRPIREYFDVCTSGCLVLPLHRQRPFAKAGFGLFDEALQDGFDVLVVNPVLAA